MAENIDSLQIEISADAVIAEKSLERLATSLVKLKNSLRGISNGQFQDLSSGVRQLSEAMQRFIGSTKTSDFTRIAAGLNKLSTVNVQGVSDASRAINTLTANLSQIGTIKFDSQGIANIANGIAQLGRKTVTQATTNIPILTQSLKVLVTGLNQIGSVTFDSASLSQLVASITKLGGKSATTAANGNITKLATALRNMMSTLSGAPKVSSNIIQMTQALAQLASAGGRAGTATRSLSTAFNGFSVSSKKASKSAGSLAAAFGKFYATYWLLLRGLDQFKKAINISSDLTEVQNVVDVTFGNMADTMNEFADSALQNYGMSELMAKKIASRFQAMGVSMGFAQGKMTEMSIELTKLAGDMASFYNVSQQEIATGLQSIFTGETEPLRRFGLDLSFATVEAWALANGIDANMQKMTQAEKTMLRYQFVLANTGAAQGDFLRTINSWHNQLVLLTGAFQQLGSIVGGVLINAFKPFIQALNSVMSAVINFAQVVSDALGAIFGWEYQVGGGVAQDFEGAAGAAEDLESATGGAADNAKKLNKYIAGWHEVNNMTSDKDSGKGSGGGAGSGSGTADGGQWVQAESIWEQYTSSIDTLYGLGEYISNVLTEAMKGIDWDSIYQSASNFGSGLASFLNGLISPELFGELGTTIGGALNTALYGLNSFGTTFDWTDFGQSIATGINNFFSTFDFGLLADTINIWANGLLDALIAGLDEVNWENIGVQIGTFLERINFLEVGKKVGEAIWKAINSGIELLKGMFSVAPIETTILTAFAGLIAFNGILGFVSGVMSKLSALFAPLTGLLSAVGAFFVEGGIFSATGPIAALSAPILALVAAFTALTAGLGIVLVTNEEVRNSFSTALSTIQNGLTPILQFVTDTLLPGLSNGWTELLKILEPFGEFLETVFADIWQEVLNPALTYIGETVLPILADTFNNVWNNVLVPFGEFLGSVLGPVIETISELLTILWKNVGVPLSDFLGKVFSASFEGIAKIFNNTLIPVVNDIIDVFQFMWNNVFVPIGSFLEDTFKPIFETVFEAIGGIIDGLGTSLQGLIQFVTGTFSGDWESAWEGVKNIFKGIFNGIVSVAESAVNFIIKGINLLSFDIPDWVPEFGGKTFGFNIDEISLPRLAKGGIINSPTVALVGESGAEAVVPLERNTQWINAVSGNIASQFGSQMPALDLSVDTSRFKYQPAKIDIGKATGQIREAIDYTFASGGIIDYNRLGQAVYQAQTQAMKENPLKIGDRDIFDANVRETRRFGARTHKNPYPIY